MNDQPKLAGEWTAETVATHSWQKIADAHNAALAAMERSRSDWCRAAVDAEKQLADERQVVFNLDKQVQEITEALITARQQLVAEKEGQ